jgi:hypothetical protein
MLSFQVASPRARCVKRCSRYSNVNPIAPVTLVAETACQGDSRAGMRKDRTDVQDRLANDGCSTSIREQSRDRRVVAHKQPVSAIDLGLSRERRAIRSATVPQGDQVPLATESDRRNGGEVIDPIGHSEQRGSLGEVVGAACCVSDDGGRKTVGETLEHGPTQQSVNPPVQTICSTSICRKAECSCCGEGASSSASFSDVARVDRERNPGDELRILAGEP